MNAVKFFLYMFGMFSSLIAFVSFVYFYLKFFFLIDLKEFFIHYASFFAANIFLAYCLLFHFYILNALLCLLCDQICQYFS